MAGLERWFCRVGPGAAAATPRSLTESRSGTHPAPAEAEAGVVHILREFSFLTCTVQLFFVYAPNCTPITTVSNNSRIFDHQPSGFSQLFQTHIKFEDQWATSVFLYDCFKITYKMPFWHSDPHSCLELHQPLYMSQSSSLRLRR